MTTASTTQTQTQTPILGQWALTAKLGRRREYVLYSAQHVSTGQLACLRILGSDATAAEKDRFLAEVAIVSKHKNHFVPVHALQSHGESLVGVSEIPATTLADVSLADRVPAIVLVCQQMAESLQVLHEAGRVHGALCREAVEVVNTRSSQIRLLDVGLGLMLGHSYSLAGQPHLPPEIRGVANASVDFDIYSLGVVGLELMKDANGNYIPGTASDALRDLFLACCASAPSARPYTLSIVQRRLLDISHLPTAQAPTVVRPPRTSSGAAQLTAVEAQWFVNDCLTEAEVTAIDGFAPDRMSTPARFLASLLSVTAGTALAMMCAAMFGIKAFGY